MKLNHLNVMTNRSKNTFYLIGNILAFVGIIFVGFRLFSQSDSIHLLLLDSEYISIFVMLLIASSMSNMFLVLAYSNILLHLGALWKLKNNFIIYGIAQIAKYVPGNIFHLVSRQVLGLSFGISNSLSIKATIFEFVLIFIIGVFCSAFMFLIFFRILTEEFAALVLALPVIVFGSYIFKYIGKNIVFALMNYAAFFITASFIFVFLLLYTAADHNFQYDDIIFFCIAYLVAYMAGIFMPGAPAGVGVREFLLLILLQSYLSENIVLSAVVSSRVLTVGGDMIFFLFAQVLNKGK